MTDEEFYKNKVIELLNKLEWLSLDGLEVKADSDGRVIDIKRKLIIKEKTWYKIRSGERLYIIGLFPPWIQACYPVVGSLLNGVSQYFTKDGRYSNSTEDKESDWDIMSECTSEEVREIEDKLRGKNEEPN